MEDELEQYRDPEPYELEQYRVPSPVEPTDVLLRYCINNGCGLCSLITLFVAIYIP